MSNASIFKTQPFAHQLEVWNISKDLEVFALLMEQGTGKTKVVIDTAAWLYGRGQIEALFVSAPNGVHLNWVLNEIPTHLHDSIPVRAVYWSATRTKKKQREVDSLYDPDFNGLRVFAVNVDAFNTPRGKKAIAKFLRTFKCMWAKDESSRIKNPNAKRTETIVNMGSLARYRRIMTGTPVTQGPFDLFSQFQFLDPFILGTQSFTAFKAEYSVLLPHDSGLMRHIKMRIAQKRGWDVDDPRKAEAFAKIMPPMVAKDSLGRPKYRNLDKLAKLIAPHSYRVRKEDCLDLPPKLYQRIYCELEEEKQRPMYDALRDELRLLLKSGELLTVTKLTMFVRLQQILCGYGPDDTGLNFNVPIFASPLENPRVQAVINGVAETTGGVIIWSRFTQGIKDIVAALKECFPEDESVVYYGDVKQADRHRAVEEFQKGNARFFVGQQQSGGIGLTLTAARTMVYFANDFSLETRLQSEDRAHRIGQRNPVTYLDIEAVETMDKRIIEALRNKRDVANLITGDPKCEWI